MTDDPLPPEGLKQPSAWLQRLLWLIPATVYCCGLIAHLTFAFIPESRDVGYMYPVVIEMGLFGAALLLGLPFAADQHDWLPRPLGWVGWIILAVIAIVLVVSYSPH